MNYSKPKIPVTLQYLCNISVVENIIPCVAFIINRRFCFGFRANPSAAFLMKMSFIHNYVSKPTFVFELN